MSSRMGMPVKKWRTLNRSDCAMTIHATKMAMYQWLIENGLATDDVHVLCDEGYGNGWEIVPVQRTYHMR